MGSKFSKHARQSKQPVTKRAKKKGGFAHHLSQVANVVIESMCWEGPTTFAEVFSKYQG